MSKVSRVRVTGPLADYAPGFEGVLAERGYARLSAANQLRLMAHLSRWLEDEGLAASALSAERVMQYLEARRTQGYTCWLSPRGLAPLLRYLGELAVTPGAAPVARPTPAERVVEAYRRYLVRERGLAASTVGHYCDVARLFLSQRSATGELDVARLAGGDITGFVLGQCDGRSVGWAKNLVTGLRSFLRFLYVEGLVANELAQVVPAVAGWRGASLPRALAPDQVARLLASCDRRSTVGRRDYAIVTLLVRLGLRAGEVAALGLDDIDWRRGEVVVRGKGRRAERLPLPADVGEALVVYLRRRRRSAAARTVFVCARAPREAMTAAAVSAVVSQACQRSGLPRVGAHVLRHTAATEMLRHGSDLVEIGQVLRHRSPSTTAIYAKVDLLALRTLAQPWPSPELVRRLPGQPLRALARPWPGGAA